MNHSWSRSSLCLAQKNRPNFSELLYLEATHWWSLDRATLSARICGRMAHRCLQSEFCVCNTVFPKKSKTSINHQRSMIDESSAIEGHFAPATDATDLANASLRDSRACSFIRWDSSGTVHNPELPVRIECNLLLSDELLQIVLDFRITIRWVDNPYWYLPR